MIKSVGFIGAGNMGGALLCGIPNVAPYNLYVFDIDVGKTRYITDRTSAKSVSSLIELAECCDVVILAVKPDKIRCVSVEINDKLRAGALVVSIAAGIETKKLKQWLPSASKIARVMPNTPVKVGEGVCCIAENLEFDEIDKNFLAEFFGCFGKTYFVEEKLINAVTSISGSGPAYAFMFIEALADAGVREGLSRQLARDLSVQTLIGAAKMVEAGGHPAQLREDVCSPGGTTIEAVKALEDSGFRSAVFAAVGACAKKAAGISDG